MIILLILLAFLFITYIAVGKKNRKVYIFSSFLLLVIFAALRSYRVGPDGAVYVNYFQSLKTMDYSDIAGYFTKEPFFYYVTKWLQDLGLNLQGWYGIIGGIFALGVCKIVYQYSEHAFLSFLSLLALGYYTFSFTGLRQTVALSMVILSIPLLEKKKYFFYILIVLLAGLFHNSALIFLIMLVIQNIKFSFRQYVVTIIIGIVCTFIFRGPIYNLLYLIVENTGRFEGYAGYSYGLSWAGFIIQVSILLFSLFCMDEETRERNRLFLNLSFAGIFFQMFSSLIAEMFRISMYFSISNIILISNVCMGNRFTKGSKQMATFIVASILLIYLIQSNWNYQYIFYWQNGG